MRLTNIKILILFVNLLLISTIHGQVNLSRIELTTFYSRTLGVEKKFNVYIPYGYDVSFTRYPVVYFLRNHEAEWFRGDLSGRDGTALKEVIDNLINQDIIGNMIIIAPNTGSDGGSFSCLGVNMLRPDLTYGRSGIGTGLFEDYIVELINHVDSRFRTIPNKDHRGIDGFSLGGYSSTMLALKHPELFCSVGSFDGSIMHLDLDDHTEPGELDDWWMDDNYYITNPVFDNPKNIPYMLSHSPSNILYSAESDKLDSIKTIRFHISCASDSMNTNLVRNLQFMSIMKQKGIRNNYNNEILFSTATHTYGNADLHATGSLITHWQAFNKTQISTPGIVPFGKVNCDIGAKSYVEIYNYGPDSITISSISNSEPIFQLVDILQLPQTLYEGDTLTFGVEFNPVVNTVCTDLIDITSNDPVTPISKIVLCGEGFIDDSIQEIFPTALQLYQNYPNPFNTITTIRYDLNEKSYVELNIFNTNGELIENLVNKIQDTGAYHINYNAEKLTAGLYFYELKVNGFSVQNRKLLYLK